MAKKRGRRAGKGRWRPSYAKTFRVPTEEPERNYRVQIGDLVFEVHSLHAVDCLLMSWKKRFVPAKLTYTNSRGQTVIVDRWTGFGVPRMFCSVTSSDLKWRPPNGQRDHLMRGKYKHLMTKD